MQQVTLSKVRQRIVAIVVLLMVAVIGTMGWSLWSEYRTHIKSAEQKARTYARALAEHAERTFDEGGRLVADTINEINLSGGISALSDRQLHDLLHRKVQSSSPYGSLVVVNQSGLLYAHSLEFPMKTANVADRDYFIFHRDNPAQGMFISRPLKSRVNNRWRITISRPLRDRTGGFAGLVAVALDLEYFQKFYGSLGLGARERVMLLRRDGAVLVNEPFSEQGLSQDFSRSKLFRIYLPSAPSGTFQLDRGVMLEKSPRINSYVSLASMPVVANISLSRDDALQPWRSKVFQQVALTFVLSGLAVLLALMLLRHIRQLEDMGQLLELTDRELYQKAQEWQTTFDAVSDAIWILGKDRRIVRTNRATEKIFGVPPEKSIGRTCCAVAHDCVTPLPTCPFAAMEKSRIRQSMELPINGAWYQVSVDPIFDADGAVKGAVHIVSDITRRKLSELRDQARADILERLAGGEPLVSLLELVVRSVEQELSGANASILLVDEKSEQLTLAVAPNIPEPYRKTAEGLAIREGESVSGTAACRRSRVVVEDVAEDPLCSSFRDTALEAGFRACWAQPIIAPEGGLLGVLAIHLVRPAVPDSQMVTCIESAAHLASIALERERTAREHEQLEQQLRHSQKMEAIGHLAGGIAHDFNNLLTPIMGYAEMVRHQLPDDSPLYDKLGGVVNAAGKARDLTRQLLTFGRKQVLSIVTIDLNAVVSGFRDIIRRTIREDIELVLDLDAASPFIKADSGQVEQVLLNLAVNAQDAISAQGTIRISTERLFMDGENARIHPGLMEGDYILLAFADSGCGMNDETLSHIFEPFFTTKQTGHGTGLGLATVYGIVKQHGGFISVFSRPGEGTIFKMYFPACDRCDLPSAVPASAASTESVTTARMLVVEDNQMVREMVVDMLTEQGYEVVSVSDPLQALECIEQRGERFEMLVSDVVMPYMSGPQMFERLSVTQPDLKVLFLSGYPSSIDVHSGTLEEGVNFLAKPFSALELQQRIRRILDGGGGAA